MIRGKITIDKDRCKGCEYCIIYCPQKCIALSRDINMRGVQYAVFINPEPCTACTICARICPDICIEVFQRKGGPLYQKMEDTISKIIDSGLDKLKPIDKQDGQEHTAKKSHQIFKKEDKT
ncbi:MAG: ferredoxin family protein [Candidatus Omnitrophica bacterium]|nr:ferredoxin family protein [Candidatus Omnitrophota bacterium]